MSPTVNELNICDVPKSVCILQKDDIEIAKYIESRKYATKHPYYIGMLRPLPLDRV
jgi:hypothetical protein